MNTIPGLADRVRQRAVKLLETKKYRRTASFESVMSLTDDEVLAVGPNTESLAADYPHGSSDWREWKAYEQRVATLVTTKRLNEWCGDVIRAAQRKKAA